MLLKINGVPWPVRLTAIMVMVAAVAGGCAVSMVPKHASEMAESEAVALITRVLTEGSVWSGQGWSKMEDVAVSPEELRGRYHDVFAAQAHRNWMTARTGKASRYYTPPPRAVHLRFAEVARIDVTGFHRNDARSLYVTFYRSDAEQLAKRAETIIDSIEILCPQEISEQAFLSALLVLSHNIEKKVYFVY